MQIFGIDVPDEVLVIPYKPKMRHNSKGLTVLLGTSAAYQEIPDDADLINFSTYRCINPFITETSKYKYVFQISHCKKHLDFWWEMLDKRGIPDPTWKIGPFAMAHDAYQDMLKVFEMTKQDLERLT